MVPPKDQNLILFILLVLKNNFNKMFCVGQWVSFRTRHWQHRTEKAGASQIFPPVFDPKHEYCFDSERVWPDFFANGCMSLRFLAGGSGSGKASDTWEPRAENSPGNFSWSNRIPGPASSLSGYRQPAKLNHQICQDSVII